MPNKKLVFRLQDESNQNLGLANGDHWFESNQYSDEQIKAIPSGNEAIQDEPTSIPSPFARIALAKTAFNVVASEFKRINENKKPILAAYQKIVSDCLDVAQIFFNYDNLKDRVEILCWDRAADLQTMRKSTKQNELGKTLETFLTNEGDIADYHFDKIDKIYILCYKGKGSSVKPKLDIIGATSPSTLFFSSGNKYRYVTENIQFDSHKAFGKTPVHLYQRDLNFIEYLKRYCEMVRESFQDSMVLKELYDYINLNISLLTDDQKKILNEDCSTKSISNAGGNSVDIFVKKDNSGDVTPYGFQQKAEGYQWKDFLEDKIIQLPYLMTPSFYDGGLEFNQSDNSSNRSYLLPLTKTFFNFFSISELVSDRMVSIFDGGGAVIQVKIRLPNSSGIFVEYIKEYTKSTDIVENDIVIALFPNIKFLEEKDSLHTFWLSSKNNINYKAEFYNKDNKIDYEIELPHFPFLRELETTKLSKTYSIDKSFDNIRISYKDGNKEFNGVIIPNFYVQTQGAEKFTFAVDFGTTNTHVEYSKEGSNQIVPFDINEKDKQFHLSYYGDANISIVSDFDFIPQYVGDDSFFKFPTRTALACSKATNWGNELKPFSQVNIALPYEKKSIPHHDKIYTQLKWSSNNEPSRYYIYSICYLIRNKVILNNGNLKSTKIVWFYPASMAGTRRQIIENIWREAYSKYFLGTNISNLDSDDEHTKINIELNKNLIFYMESIAPYIYYKEHKDYKNTISDVVSIDIGGGTTDVVIVQNKKIESITSFRFAANSIFGTSTEGSSGIINQYQKIFETIINDNDENFKLANLLGDIKNDENNDMASFFFSLSQNKMLQNVSRDKIDFTKILIKDERQKLIFVLFYTAIIYHIAKLMKAKELEKPRHITFSGNGSRLLQIVASHSVLSDLTTVIIEKIYDEKYDESGLDIIHNIINPKEVTCKGGIIGAKGNHDNFINIEKVILLGIDDTSFVTDEMYDNINVTQLKNGAVNEVRKFISFVLDDLLKAKTRSGDIEESFINALNINSTSLDYARLECLKERDLDAFFTNSLNKKIRELKDMGRPSEIEETFFFYPLNGLLQSLSKAFASPDKMNKAIDKQRNSSRE